VSVDERHSVLEFDFDDKLGELVDGQHRLEGLTLAARNNGALLDEFEMPVVFMLDLSADQKGYVFSIINSKQIQVPSSLIVDLLGLQVSRSPKKTCHEIAQTLNARSGSPFFRGIKMLGNKEFDSEFLTQGSFAKYLLKLLSKTPDEDARREKKGINLQPDSTLPFRGLYIAREDGAIAKILENYFCVIAELYPQAWHGKAKEYLLRKTVGFAALIRVFEIIWPRAFALRDASRSRFEELLSPLRNSFEETRFRSGSYASSGQGATQLAGDLLQALGIENPFRLQATRRVSLDSTPPLPGADDTTRTG